MARDNSEGAVDLDAERRRRSGWGIPVASALFIFGYLTYLFCFFPGFMSTDSAHQPLEARCDEISDWHSPFMTAIWQLLDHFAPGPPWLAGTYRRALLSRALTSLLIFTFRNIRGRFCTRDQRSPVRFFMSIERFFRSNSRRAPRSHCSSSPCAPAHRLSVECERDPAIGS